MFARHGFSSEQANVQGMTAIYTQIGNISMQVKKTTEERHARVQQLHAIPDTKGRPIHFITTAGQPSQRCKHRLPGKVQRLYWRGRLIG
ncbi:hypothetical protein RC74_17685 [Falsihalocynthiibacter arcticus]|uniref:Uncharacterized protein n=1 Tax=Falsihalocynthiibacter arcticus TaxID=1579316 RepID=A0A126V4F5_9RHOB|nr:hypothetical protein RC74_17685 [Falsihalocynthiibacter arcticus]